MKRTAGQPDLAPEGRAFVERLEAGFRPAPLSASQRAAFDAALAERIDRRRGRWRRLGLVGLPAAVAAALVGVWLATGEGAGPAAGFPAQAWEEEVLLLDASFESQVEADLQVFPEEYLAIESAML